MSKVIFFYIFLSPHSRMILTKIHSSFILLENVISELKTSTRHLTGQESKIHRLKDFAQRQTAEPTSTCP